MHLELYPTSATATSSRTQPIPVTLESRALLLAIISSEIKMGKLQTSPLASALPDDVDFTLIRLNHINFN